MEVILEMKNRDFLSEKGKVRGSITIVTLTSSLAFAAKKARFAVQNFTSGWVLVWQ